MTMEIGLRKAIAGAALLVLTCGAIAIAQPAAPVGTPLQDAPVSGHADLHAVTVIVDWAPGTATVTHTHPGDEYAVVIEGELTLWAEGQPDRLVHAGEAYFNPRGLVHGARNDGAIPARSIITFVTDVGVPTLTPVP